MRDRQRGNTVVLSLIVLSALATLGGLTVMSVRGGIATSANDRFHVMSLYAAESGGAAAMDYLRAHLDPAQGWSAFVSPHNAAIQHPPFVGNGALPGDPNNPFAADQQSWFDVEILNNRDDPGYPTGLDNDMRVIIRATGHALGGAQSVLEWEIHGDPATPSFVLVGWRVVY